MSKYDGYTEDLEDLFECFIESVHCWDLNDGSKKQIYADLKKLRNNLNKLEYLIKQDKR